MIKQFLATICRALIRLAGVECIEDHYYLPALLGPHSKVVDGGANLGRFSQAIVSRHGCHSMAVEPEAKNFSSRPPDARITWHPCALSGANGTMVLLISRDCTAHRLVADLDKDEKNSQTVVCRTLEFILKEANWSGLDLLKLDIEGMEWSVFDSMSDVQLSKIHQITVEFHDFAGLCPASDATWKIYRRLAKLGFLEVEDPDAGSYNVLFVKATSLSDPSQRLVLTVLQGAVWLSRKWHRLGCLLRLGGRTAIA